MIGISNKPSRKFNSIYYTPLAYTQKTSKFTNDFYQNSNGITKIPEADIIGRVVVEKQNSPNGKKHEKITTTKKHAQLAFFSRFFFCSALFKY